jgi:Family of unknown function (DUF6064)
VNPPFTIEQFLSVFVAYNDAIWPAQIGGYAIGLGAVLALWLHPPHASRVIFVVLAIMWTWNGLAYQFLFFSAINPAAKFFAGLFVLQASLFAASAAVTKGIQFEIGRGFRSYAGVAVIAYAMLIYPILGILAGHGLLAGPMFAVAPCPTTIFTIGWLILSNGPTVPWLSIIPLLWSLVGLAAALQLGMPEDFGLPVAALVLVVVIAKSFLRALLTRGLTEPPSETVPP